MSGIACIPHTANCLGIAYISVSLDNEWSGSPWYLSSSHVRPCLNFTQAYTCICSTQFANLHNFEIALRKLEIAKLQTSFEIAIQFRNYVAKFMQFRNCATKFTQFRNCIAQIRNSEIVQRNFESQCI